MIGGGHGKPGVFGKRQRHATLKALLSSMSQSHAHKSGFLKPKYKTSSRDRSARGSVMSSVYGTRMNSRTMRRKKSLSPLSKMLKQFTKVSVSKPRKHIRSARHKSSKAGLSKSLTNMMSF